MKRMYLLPAAYLLDYLAGDPEWFPHPVRGMGLMITRGERALRGPNESAARAMVAGVVLTAAVVGGSYLTARELIVRAGRRSCWFGDVVEVLLAWTCLAARNLDQEAQSVMVALDSGDVALARMRLARIVGRDTQNLDASDISRALIETLAESASDGVVAPLLYMALGGVPLAMAYKAVNTLDSMIGHRDVEYLYFGKVAARLDDVVNLVPSRVTALCVVAAASLSAEADGAAALMTWLRDGGKHKSPNAGQPEAAISGALHARLGGENCYGGEQVSTPHIGADYPRATPEKARRALKMTAAVGLAGLAAAMLLAAGSRRRVA